MIRETDIVNALSLSEKTQGWKFDRRHSAASAVHDIIDTKSRLRYDRIVSDRSGKTQTKRFTEKSIVINWQDGFLGGGGDSAAYICTIDFENMRYEFLNEILTDFYVHDYFRQNSTGNFEGFAKFYDDAAERVESMKRKQVKSAVLDIVNQMNFWYEDGLHTGVATVGLKKISERDTMRKTPSPTPNREMRQEFLYGLKHANLLGIILGVMSKKRLVQIAEWGGDEQWTNLEVDELVKVAMDVATGVDYLHTTYGAIHRDIKPANVLISMDGEVPVGKLADYSIVSLKELEHKGVLTKTQSGEGIGTITYIAPEQCFGQATKKSDLFGVGSLLYHFITHKHPADQSKGPRKSQDPLLVNYWQDEEKIRRLSMIMAGCLQADQLLRYEKASHIKEDLKSTLHGQEPEHINNHITRLRMDPVTYRQKVFCEEDHTQKESLTARLVTVATSSDISGSIDQPGGQSDGESAPIIQSPMSTPIYKFPRLRKVSRALGLTTFIALSTYVLTTTLNPHGAGDKMFHYLNCAYDKASGSLDKILDGN